MQTEPDWGSYFANVNDKFASIALDLGLKASAPDADRPYLLWVWVYMQAPRPDGLSDSAEFDTLVAIEDALLESIEGPCQALQAGRITTDGRREFYYYGASDTQFRDTVAAAMQKFAGYQFDVGAQADPGWQQYAQVLYPTQEDFQRIQNSRVLSQLMKHGDTLQPARDVHHWIYFRTAADRAEFVAKTQALGYSIVSETEKQDGERAFALRITRDQGVTPGEIDDAVIELFRLAGQHNGDYDGWETRIIPPSQPS